MQCMRSWYRKRQSVFTLLCKSVLCTSIFYTSVLCRSVFCTNILCTSILCTSVLCTSVLCSIVLWTNILCTSILCTSVKKGPVKFLCREVRLQKRWMWPVLVVLIRTTPCHCSMLALVLALVHQNCSTQNCVLLKVLEEVDAEKGKRWRKGWCGQYGRFKCTLNK